MLSENQMEIESLENKKITEEISSIITRLGLLDIFSTFSVESLTKEVSIYLGFSSIEDIEFQKTIFLLSDSLDKLSDSLLELISIISILRIKKSDNKLILFKILGELVEEIPKNSPIEWGELIFTIAKETNLTSSVSLSPIAEKYQNWLLKYEPNLSFFEPLIEKKELFVEEYLEILNLIKNYECDSSLKKDLIETFLEVNFEEFSEEEKIIKLLEFKEKNNELFTEDGKKIVEKLSEDIVMPANDIELVKDNNIELNIEKNSQQNLVLSGNINSIDKVLTIIKNNYSKLINKILLKKIFLTFLFSLLLFDLYIDAHRELITIFGTLGIILPTTIIIFIIKGFSRKNFFIATFLSTIILSFFTRILLLKAIFVSLILLIFEYKIIDGNSDKIVKRWDFLYNFFQEIYEEKLIDKYKVEFSSKNEKEWLNIVVVRSSFEYIFTFSDDEKIDKDDVEFVTFTIFHNGKLKNEIGEFPGSNFEIVEQNLEYIEFKSNSEDFYQSVKKIEIEIINFIKQVIN